MAFEKKSLPHLRERTILALIEVPDVMKPALFEIARDNRGSPEGATTRVRFYLGPKHQLSPGSTPLKRSEQAARFLAMIRRDYGDQALAQFLLELQGEKLPEKIWALGSGQRVVNREDSHLDPQVSELLAEVFAAIDMVGARFINYSHNFGRIIGQTICVATRQKDKIIYANRTGRPDGHTRFVDNRQPEDTSWVTVVLKLLDDGSYEIRTAYIGERAPPEPWDRYVNNKTEERDKSRQFWATHALIWDPSKVIKHTITHQLPTEWRWLER